MRAASEFVVRSYLDACDQEGALPGWGQRYTQLGSGRFRGSVTWVDFGSVTVSEERINVMTAQASAPPADKMVLVVPASPKPRGRINGESHSGIGVLQVGGSEVNVVTDENTRSLIVTIDRKALGDLDISRLGPLAPVHASEGGDLQSWLSSILATSPDATRQAPGEMEKVLPGLVIDRFKEICGTILSQKSPVQIRQSYAYSIFLRAQRLIDADFDGILTVANVCQELDVPEHVLRVAFVQSTGVTPRLWLRQRRLNRARRALLEPSEREKSVTRVAMENGFFHIGRFAAYYAEIFQETPLETIRASLM